MDLVLFRSLLRNRSENPCMCYIDDTKLSHISKWYCWAPVIDPPWCDHFFFDTGWFLIPMFVALTLSASAFFSLVKAFNWVCLPTQSTLTWSVSKIRTAYFKVFISSLVLCKSQSFSFSKEQQIEPASFLSSKCYIFIRYVLWSGCSIAYQQVYNV